MTDQPKLKPGDVAYFYEVKMEPRRNAPTIRFTNKIFGFGLMLGAVAPGMPPLSENTFMTLMGEIGFLSFDLVKEFLGEDEMKTCIEKYKVKFAPKPLPSKLILPESTNESELSQ